MARLAEMLAEPKAWISEEYQARRANCLSDAQGHFARAVALRRQGKDRALLGQARPIARDPNAPLSRPFLL
jgi:hypothetical protein